MGLEFYKTDKNKILMPLLEGLPLFEDKRPRTKSLLNDILTILEIMVWLLFSIDERVKLKNILIYKEKERGTFYVIFDFNRQNWELDYSHHRGLSSHVVTSSAQTMMIFASEDLHLPKFSVIAKRKTIFHTLFTSICRLFGYHKKQGENISQIFSSRISEFYKAEKNLCTAAQGYRLICYRNNTIIKPKKIQSFLSAGFQALELFKAVDSVSLKQDVDYTKLRDFLKAGNFKEADKETTTILLKAIGKKVEDTAKTNITIILLENIFFSPVIRTIDALWTEYSKEHFGFSVQKRIWLEIGGKVNYNTERLLADRVGWREQGKWLYYSDLTFSLNAPPGHLPTTELSLLPLGWFYFGKRPLFKIPGTIGLVRRMNLPACSIASNLYSTFGSYEVHL
jgi:hypothetical protein